MPARFCWMHKFDNFIYLYTLDLNKHTWVGMKVCMHVNMLFFTAWNTTNVSPVGYLLSYAESWLGLCCHFILNIGDDAVKHVFCI